MGLQLGQMGILWGNGWRNWRNMSGFKLIEESGNLVERTTEIQWGHHTMLYNGDIIEISTSDPTAPWIHCLRLHILGIPRIPHSLVLEKLINPAWHVGMMGSPRFWVKFCHVLSLYHAYFMDQYTTYMTRFCVIYVIFMSNTNKYGIATS